MTLGAGAPRLAAGLTLWQPWATLIALKKKTVETRSWRPPDPYVGTRIAIHASAKMPEEGAAALEVEPFATALAGRELPCGVVVATAKLARVGPTAAASAQMLARAAAGDDDIRRVHSELAFGDFSEGRWAWKLTDIVPMEPPVECKGAQKLWSLPIDVEERLRALEYDYFTPPLGFGGELPQDACPECNGDEFIIAPVCCRQYRHTGECCGEPDMEDVDCPSCQA